MPHFFINSKDIREGKAYVSEDYNHIAKSLRAKAGEKLLLIDEKEIQYETIIEKIAQGTVVAKIEKSYKSNRKLDFELYLAQSPLRSDAQNIIIEKATELGVAGVYPLITDNCTVKKSVIESKVVKWQKIASEASKQCERANIPKVYNLTKLEEIKGFDKVLAFCERDTKLTLHKFLNENPIKKNEKMLVIIGPEGGFSPREFKYFQDNKIPMISLGNLILKAETAVIVGLGNVLHEYNK